MDLNTKDAFLNIARHKGQINCTADHCNVSTGGIRSTNKRSRLEDGRKTPALYQSGYPTIL